MQESMPPKRTSAWPRAIGVAGVGLAAVLGGVWLVRAPLADWALRQALNDRGVAGDWRITHLDTTRIELADVRLGDSQAPDFTANAATATWRWTALGPRLDEIALGQPQLALAIDRGGLQLRDLSKLAGGPSDAAARLPDLAVRVTDGQIALSTPAGLAHGRLTAAGRLGADFKAELAFTAPGAAPSASPALTGSLTAPADGPRLAFSGRLEALPWEGITLRGLHVQGAAKAPRDLSRADVRFIAGASAVELGAAQVAYASLTGAVTVNRFGPGLRPDSWRGDGAVIAQGVAAQAIDASDLALHWDATGDSARAAGSWRLSADRAEAGGVAAALAGAGSFSLTQNLTLDADGALAMGPAKTGAITTPALPPLAGTPLAPLIADTAPRIARALSAYQAQAPLRFLWRKDKGRIDIAGPLTATARTGARLEAEPTAADQPLLTITLPGGAIRGGGRVGLAGGGLPTLSAAISPFQLGGETRDIAARFDLADWRGGGAAVSVRNGEVFLDGANPDAAFRFAGDLTMSGPLAGGAVRNLRGRVDLVGTVGMTMRVGPAQRTLRLAYDGLDLANLRFGRGDLALSPDSSGAFVRIGADGKLSGGLQTGPLRLSGATKDGLPARLDIAALSGALSGTPAAAVFQGEARQTRLAMDLADARTLEVAAAAAPFDARFGADGWRVDGKAVDSVIIDPSLPAHIEQLAVDWRMIPAGDSVRFTIANGRARVTDKEAKPRFNPLLLAGVSGELADGAFTSTGTITLQSKGATLARFTGRHDLESGAGSAQVKVRDLTFSPTLELYEVTALALGVVENVAGPVDGDFEARWSPARFEVDGALTLKDVSAATAGLGPVNGVSGRVRFDDLALLTTPPGQRLTVASVNPGIEVRDGEIGFQLKPNGVVALESAAFPFAKGKLSVQPTEVTIGAPESRYTLLLKDVDVAAFIEEMKFKDLTATGTIEGAFPLVIRPNRAVIENGRITAGKTGGLIQYTGAAGKGAGEGVGQIAFQALQGFRYDQLEIDINGPLDSEVVANLRFRGVNVAPVEIAPGLGRVARADGLPFRFNVSVTAPFRALAESAKNAANPLDLLRAAQPLPPPPQ
jgi:translocation and assembly module TamB